MEEINTLKTVEVEQYAQSTASNSDPEPQRLVPLSVRMQLPEATGLKRLQAAATAVDLAASFHGGAERKGGSVRCLRDKLS